MTDDIKTTDAAVADATPAIHEATPEEIAQIQGVANRVLDALAEDGPVPAIAVHGLIHVLAAITVRATNDVKSARDAVVEFFDHLLSTAEG